MEIEIVGHLGSLYLMSTSLEMIELNLEAKKALLETLLVLLVIHNSLKKLS